MDISVIIPVLNEEKNIPILLEKLVNSLGQLQKKWEVIFVDDGSTDATLFILKKIKEKFSQIKIIKFGINSGKAAAYTAGFQFAKGNIVITMDGDLQDDPGEIPVFLSELEKGADLVVGWKYKGKGRKSKTFSSRVFNLLLKLLTGLKINDSNCPFRAMRSEVAKSLSLYGNLYRFIPHLAFQKGYKVTEIKVENYPRQFGFSKYGVSRFFDGLMDLMTIIFISRYRTSPLHFFGIPGLLFFFFGLFIDLFLVLRGLLITGRIGHTALLIMGVMLIVVGIQFISLGLLGELIITGRKLELRDLPIQEIIE
ncbi:MAG: glycosyltransferase family 2 protein [Desulfobacterota bacterium]|nr:glycosyltransferase family 2 protein [Thermodesulfobacteriota bacterium]